MVKRGNRVKPGKAGKFIAMLVLMVCLSVGAYAKMDVNRLVYRGYDIMEVTEETQALYKDGVMYRVNHVVGPEYFRTENTKELSLIVQDVEKGRSFMYLFKDDTVVYSLELNEEGPGVFLLISKLDNSLATDYAFLVEVGFLTDEQLHHLQGELAYLVEKMREL